MICSLNEVGGTLRKAAVGAGLTVGLADASAAAGVWLCAHGLDGVGALLAAADRATTEPEIDIDSDRLTVTISRAGVGRCGPSVFDLLRTETIQRVVVEAPDSPLLLIGFAGTAAQASGVAFDLIDEAGSKVKVSPRSWTGATEFGGLGRVDAVPTRWSGTTANPMPVGVDVDEAAWAQALEFAQRTYVPATEESRISGAGAGLTDND